MAADALAIVDARTANIENAHLLAAQLGKTFVEDKTPRAAMVPLRVYARDFYVWEYPKPPACPRCQGRLQARKRIGPEWARDQRKRLVDHVFKDPIADMPLALIRKGDCRDFRSRLLAKLGTTDPESPGMKRTANLIMMALSGVLSEAVDREDIGRNPAAKLAVQYDETVRGTFTLPELRAMFPKQVDKLGPWRTLMEKTLYLTAATMGLRRGELRALPWGAVDLENRKLSVAVAVKGRRVGTTKSRKAREPKIPNVTARHLTALRPKDADPKRLVFSNADGSRIGGTWWQLAWRRALGKLKIDWRMRHLSAHSYRHSLATELRAKDISDALLMESLGWGSKAVADRYAGHLTADHLSSVANAVDKLLG